MKKVFIIHGFGGTPNGGWLPWFMEQMQKKDIYCCALPMPDTHNPVMNEWIDEIKHAVKKPNEEIFLLGHSLGATAVLRYLESLPEGSKIGGVVLLAGLLDPLDPENKESRFRSIDSFVRPAINFEKIKGKSQKFIVVHGTEDVTVPYSQAEKIAANLNCQLKPVVGATHFSQRTPPIYYEVPEALQALEEIME